MNRLKSFFYVLAIIYRLSSYAQHDTIDIMSLSLEELMKLEVTTAGKTEQKLSDAPGVIAVIHSTEIKMFACRNLSDILDRATSIFVFGSYAFPDNMITIRGEATSHYNTHILLLINGRPFHASKEGYSQPLIRAFPVETIERIEILRGPGSALYGTAAYAGVINVITKTGDRQNSTASFNYGSFGTVTGNIASGFEKGNFSMSVGGYFMKSDGWDYNIRNGAIVDGEKTILPQYYFPAEENATGATMKMKYKNLTINSFIGYNLQMAFQLYGGKEWHVGETHSLIDLGYKHEFNAKLNSQLNLTYNHLHLWQPRDQLAYNDRETGSFNDYMIELINFYQPIDNLRLTIGGVLTNRTGIIENFERTADKEPHDIWENENTNPFKVVPQYTEMWWNTYANAIYEIMPFASLVAGVQVNKVPNIKLDVVPRVGLIFGFDTPFYVKLLYGQAFRSADSFELNSQIDVIRGNPNLLPEDIKTYEIQVAYSRKTINLSATYFNSLQTNTITRSLASDSILVEDGVSYPVYINLGGLNSYGVEVDGKANVDDNLLLYFSALYHENENFEGQKNIYGIPNVFVKTGLQYATQRGINLGVFNTWVSKGNEFDANFNINPPADAFDYLTAKVSVNLNKFLKLNNTSDIILNFSGVNLLNAEIHYPEYGLKNVNTIPGRSGIALYGGLKINLN